MNSSSKYIPKTNNPSNKTEWVLSGFLNIIFSAILTIIILTVAYNWVNPPYTWLMVYRYVKTEQTKLKPIRHSWVNIESVSPYVAQAAVAAEDNLFLSHRGFDINSIKEAREEMRKGIRTRGASTISMQVSKNVFLWHSKSWTRKIIESGFTILIETLWSKKRIMEVYLNVAEFGPSIYGVEAASEEYFKKSANELNKNEAALLVTVLPNPLRRNPKNPSNYMLNYQKRVRRNMYNIGDVTFNK
ncbi:MAG: monofunctional biosynthetic peptidoglycan transglycosylase [Perlabentimonas sp.]